MVESQHQCLDDSPRYQSKYVEPILNRLKQKGYTIYPGYLYWITNMSKHGGSPASSYGMWYISNISSKLRPNPDATMAQLFGPSDSILFTGCTAPNATYIGFENYAYSKFRPNGTNNTMSLVFSSMGGAINQWFLNVSNDYGSGPFDAITTIITTGDKVTFNDIYEEYQYRNISHTVNNLWIPNEYFKFTPYNFTKYHEYTAWNYPVSIDTFMPVTRIINHLNVDDWHYYVSYKQPVYWLTAEKLRPQNTTQPRVPFTELYTRNTTSSRDEFYLLDDLNTYINDTINYFESAENMELIGQHQLINYNLGEHDYGFVCYENNWNCQGDLRDEQYWGTHNGSNVVRRSIDRPQGAYNLFNDSYFVVIGINHYITNFTIYDNIIIYYMEDRWDGLYEPIGMLTHLDYNNSCNLAPIPTSINPQILLNFYIIQVGRPYLCENKNIPSMCPDEQSVDSRKKFAVNTRNLLNLETLTRPSENQIIPDLLLHFRVKQEIKVKKKNDYDLI